MAGTRLLGRARWPWRRRRGFRVSRAFIPITQPVLDHVAAVHPDEPAVLADERADTDQRSLVIVDGQRQVEVVLDARPVAIMAARGALAIRTATLEEVLHLPRVHTGDRVTSRPGSRVVR